MTNFLPFLLALAVVTVAPLAHAAENRGTIVFLGDSLTAGYGLDDPLGLAFPGVIQNKLDETGLNYRVINAGVSGDTSAGGLRRVDWILRQPVDVFVVALGGNDGLRGLPVESLRENLRRILQKVRAKNPDAELVVAGMQMPPNMGSYAADFARVYPEVAREFDATLVPFLLEGVGGSRTLNLPDGIHPTAEGQAILAETVWRHLQPLLATARS